MDMEIFKTLVTEGVSLAILMAVLYGVYRLAIRFSVIMGEHVSRCCESLERLADAAEYWNKRER
jgi:hypothetical protein